jgi:hypothetical protein
MASRSTGPPSNGARALRRALLAAATLGACALIPQSSTALAAKSTTTSASPPPVEGAAVPHARRAEREASEENASAPVATPPPEAPVAHGRHASPSPAALAPPPPISGSSAGARHAGSGAGASTQSAHGRERSSATHGTAGSAGSAGTGEANEGVAAAGVTSGDQSTQGAEALARQKRGTGGEKGAGKKQKEKTKGKGKGKGKETEAESVAPAEAESVKQHGASGAGANSKSDVLATEAQPAPAEATADAASIAALLASPSSGTGGASIATASPAAKGTAAGGARASHERRRTHRAKRAGAITPAAGVIAVASGAPASAATGSPSTPHARHAETKQTHAASTQPALVKTITKIVGVVPSPVRILIGALIALALALGLRSLFASIRTRRLVRQRGELLEDVGLLQAALLPETPSRLGPVGTSVAYRPADGPGAGGDFYDVFALADGRLAVIVGDVSGHGREALPHTALVRFTVRAYLEAGLAPAEALQTAGVVLERQLGDSFATVIAAIYHPRERTLTYATAGHPPPVVLGEPAVDGTFAQAATVTSCAPPPIGAQRRTGMRQTVVSVPGAARICFHTDGVTEARIGVELFGAERLARTLAELGEDAGAAELLDGVAARSDARPDDMAACVLQVHGDAGAPVVLSERVELDDESLQRGRVERFLHDSGVEPAQAAAALDAARAELARTSSAVLQLHFEQGVAVASVCPDNVVSPEPLAVARAS